jgi:hypothetical protein
MLARLRRPKATCSVPYVDYRPNRNITILWKTSHSKDRSLTGEVGKLRTWIGLIYSLYENEYRNLKHTETTIRKELR